MDGNCIQRRRSDSTGVRKQIYSKNKNCRCRLPRGEKKNILISSLLAVYNSSVTGIFLPVAVGSKSNRFKVSAIA